MSLFKVLQITDTRKHGSELMVGNTYRGELDSSGTKVYYTDRADSKWIFYVGETCELITDGTLKAAAHAIH
jgi:hypothetical protein